ncbi:D-alanyl-D-alanine carboxypeptidase [Dactylosporangium sp. AC04546]|uniref:D-alanyl-D-alanine carboxypeptidase family protein n=1 Tax=Dactylosporangium sp. AC04546 TaxID=2862460 RepID=UPI001EDF89CD|nr:D-alanyl-D-alanine carboxypeptidase [Dactylosporangium sp. AC04546]WVK87169.1 D-alanyl-D-alanine carboxypeptidase [Dactylosporangium sp. AC04546]
MSVAAAVVVLAAGGFVTFRLTRAVPAPQIKQTLPQTYTIPGVAPVLPWPQAGQATVEIDGLGRLGSSGGSKPVPIASVAKVMTAYLILRDHPLRLDENGPTMIVTPEEAAAYPAQLASGESLVQVVAGEVLTERQALQALLLPSANNIAHILARWDAGSSAAFVTKMNQAAAQLGMADTRYTDPSGLSPTTVSTAADQVTLGRVAMQEPVLAQIVAMPKATLPVVGQVDNVNTQLGKDGIIGIKTGFTDEAGGCLLFAAEITSEGQRLRVIGAVLAPGPSTADAFEASRRLIQASSGLVHKYKVVHADEVVATLRGPTGRSTPLAATGDVNVLGWPGLTYRIDTVAALPGRIAAGSDAGTLKLTASAIAATTAVRATDALAPPGWWERITHG